MPVQIKYHAIEMSSRLCECRGYFEGATHDGLTPNLRSGNYFVVINWKLFVAYNHEVYGDGHL